MSRYFFSSLFSALVLLCSCEAYKNRQMNLEYEQIKASGKTGRELFDALTEFERNNTVHFSSKVDLGGVYLLQGDYGRAKDYFLRAAAVLRYAGDDAESKKNIVIMYDSLARIALAEGDYEPAMGYAEQAIALDGESGHYMLLKGHILAAQNKDVEALAVFDSLYPAADTVTAVDLRTYMYLLARAERTEECAAIVDRYFETGPYFKGLGTFASGVFERAGQTKKAILSAWLEYEYFSSFNAADDAAYLTGIDGLERQLAQKGTLEAGMGAIKLLRRLYGGAAAPLREAESFFVEEYIFIKISIRENTAGIAEFNRLLQMEHYFSQFPAYYWNVWQTVSLLDPGVRQNFARVLEKIIALDKDGVYARRAWDELGALMGYGAR
jgi:tetratricopeptide (TPR) repeat protein